MGKRAKPFVLAQRVRSLAIAIGALLSVILVIMGCVSSQAIPGAAPTTAVQSVSPSVSPTSSTTPEPSATMQAVLPPVDQSAPPVPRAQEPVVAPPVQVVPTAEVPTRIIYPEANIDMLVAPMDGRPKVLDPPEDSNAHWLNNYGLVGTASTDTAYVVAHSCGLGYPGCSPQTFPFNNLSTRAALGQRITVQTANGEVSYKVTDVFSYNKDSAPTEKRGTWDQVPGRLVLISCYTADLLGKNVVVFAELEK